MKKIVSFLLLSVFFMHIALADEGMWLPLFLNKYNIEDMQKKGFKLTAEDIYSVNNASLKDAVPIFGRGCTSVMVSDQGLLLTNHHCGYGQIQEHSSVEHDYLTNGFWAMNKEQELPNPGLAVTFLVRMEDVTDELLNGISDDTPEDQRATQIKNKSVEIINKAVFGTHYKAKIKPFFLGNRYFLFVEEIFTDVRLVGTPPSAIGKFGGDTDNWMWPRHTGDFSVFRIYADKNNKPADYSQDNVPYKPKKFLKVSMKGVQQGDFTMVLGYPGTTQEYLPSFAVDLIEKLYNPHKIALRQKRIDIMGYEMEKSSAVRIKYSAKYAGVSNSWKKWIGESRGLKRLNAVEKKKAIEKEFQIWADSKPELKAKYGTLLSEYEKAYAEISKYQHLTNYIGEGIFSIEAVSAARRFETLAEVNSETSKEDIDANKKTLLAWTEDFFKDYYQPIDKKIFEEILIMYSKNVDTKYKTPTFLLIESKFKGNFSKYTNWAYEKSIFTSKQKIVDFLSTFSHKSVKKITSDPIFSLFFEIRTMYINEIDVKFSQLQSAVTVLDRKYMQGLMEMNPNKVFYPDANFTMRVSYGKVDDYIPKNGVKYLAFTTIDGIIEKDNPEIYDYDVPQKLKDLYYVKDYGKYGQNGQMNVCFAASNHTTGGNSGSPVIDANGNLLGLNFDRNWEGTMSDIMYDPEQCRNITLDVRYALFIIDKFAGATHLVDEMEIVY